MIDFLRKLFAPSRDNEVALEEVAAIRSRMRKFEAFLLREVERLKMRVKLLEVERAVRAADEKEAREAAANKDVFSVPTVRVSTTLDAFDPDKTPVEKKRPKQP